LIEIQDYARSNSEAQPQPIHIEPSLIEDWSYKNRIQIKDLHEDFIASSNRVCVL